MSTALEPITQERLNQFRRRWQHLAILKGLAVALLLALAFLLVVVIVDASVVVPEPLRWLLSLTIYAGLVLMLAATWLRVGRGQRLTETAREFEQQDPRLREQLLSAVELSQDTPTNQLSSPGFRRRLQEQVAHAIAPVRVADLLPWSSIALGVGAALVALGLTVGLSWVPGLHWPHRVARALLPGANLGRISRFDITVTQPQPASTLLPAGSVVAIEAQVAGPLPDSVLLETRVAGQLDSLSMRGITREPLINSTNYQATARQLAADDLFYTANLTVGSEPIEYRVVAEDAQTPWYRLTSTPRPDVHSFSVRIVHPSYSQLPDRTFESDVGDIAALRGSRAQLKLTCNQPIEQAWLQVNLADAPVPQKIELQAIDDQLLQFSAELPIDGDFTYRVHLQAAKTGFTNAFSSEYQVRSIIDDAPQVVWIEPQASMIVVEANQLIKLQLEARDELPIAEGLLIASLNGETPLTSTIDLSQAVPVSANQSNGAGASESDLSSATLVLTPVAHELDLLKLQVKVGDTLRVAVQVKDRAGQVNLSSPVEFIVSSAAVDSERRPATAERIELAAQLRKYAEQMQPQLKEIRQLLQAQQEQDKLPEGQRVDQRDKIQATVERYAQQARDNAAQLREKVLQTLKHPQDSVSLAELERTGQVLARIENQMADDVEGLAKKLVDASTNSATATPEQFNRLRSETEKLGDAISVIDRRFREFVAYDVLSEVARGMRVVQDFQNELVASAEQQTPAQLKRRQAVVARQLRELEQMMVDRSPLLREQGTHGLRGWIEWSGQMAERIERATNDPDDNPSFKEFSKQILVEVKQHQTVMSVDGGLDGEILNGRRELDARAESSGTTLAELARMLESAAKSESGQLSAQQAANWNQGLRLLEQRKELQQARGDADAHHVSDLGNAIRATRQVLDSPGEKLAPEQVAALAKTAKALRTLEAIHNFNEADKHLADLEQIERWNSSSIEARTESPRAWEAMKHRIEQTARSLREAGVNHQLADQVDRVRYEAPANEAGQKIQARRWSADAQVSAEANLAQMRAQMESAADGLAAVARDARVDLMEVAPTVPELARKAAERTSQLEQATDKLAQQAAADEVPDLRTGINELNARQQQAVEPINDLRDALSEMAGTQDLLDDAQRAIARDADTSQQIIDRAREQLDESMKPVSTALTTNAATQPLEQAAQTQAEARQALEQIADHFDRLQAGDAAADQLAQSRDQLQQMAKDLNSAEMDEWYKTAESLSKLAGGDPQQILKKLEEELNRNLRMREELSDIAKKALDEAVKSLAYSADQERTLQSQLEQSDPAYAARKQLLQQDIQAASERMHQWMQQLSNDAQNVTGRAGARPQQQQLNQLQQQLQQTIADASAAHSSLPLEDLQRVAAAVLESLAVATDQYQEIAGQLNPVVQQKPHASEQELKTRKREMEDWERRILQQQARGAQSVERAHEQRTRQAENAARNAESLARNAQRQRDEAAKQAEAKPDALPLKQRLLEAERQLARMEQEAEVARQREAALKERLALARQNQQEMNARKPTELSSQNPTAELAKRLSEGAATSSTAIAQELKKALADTGWTDQLAAAAGQLQSGQEQQGRVEEGVQGVANNLQRASRHEQRLEHPKAAERINEQAGRVEQTRSQEVHSAVDQLATAAQQAKENGAANAESGKVKDVASPEASLSALQSVSAAETQLRQRVQELKQMLEQAPPEEPGATSQREMAAPDQPSVPLDPKMLAQMLDELDRQMSDAESADQSDGSQEQQSSPSEAGQSQDENNQSSSQQSSPGGKQKQTSSMQQAARQLAQDMNRGRAQGRQSTASSRQTGNTADTKAAPPSPVRVLSVDRRNGEDWGKLREQSAEQTVESARQTIAPQYRSSVETYFRVLSERGGN